MDTTKITVIAMFVLIPCVVGLVGSILKAARAGSEKYKAILEGFQARVDEVLEENEVVEAVCGYMPCAAVTNKRLIMGRETGVFSVQFSDIKSLTGRNASNFKTDDPGRMLSLEIEAGKTYLLGNHSEGFTEVVEALYEHVEG